MGEFTIDAWLDGVSGKGWKWYAKRLSANDTLATGGHQAGPYIPKRVLFECFPSLDARSAMENPDVEFPASIQSHAHKRTVRAVWYNNRLTGEGTRDECRVTRWGGSESPLLDPESTGSLCLMAFHQTEGRIDAISCEIWLCLSVEEEEFLEDRIGPVDPGEGVFLEFGNGAVPIEQVVTEYRLQRCFLSEEDIPDAWKQDFPSTTDILKKVIEVFEDGKSEPDRRLLNRRDCEFNVFRSVEEFHILPVIKKGFTDISGFLEFANSVMQRRKSRSGRSLELQLAKIFVEENLSFSHGAISEGNKKPDFLFPSVEAYQEAAPVSSPTRIRMLAAKTTCTDRWRQILN
ncbi:MAG: type II restriction endonuclease, partial [Ktedonobacteraceae bacterium]